MDLDEVKSPWNGNYIIDLTQAYKDHDGSEIVSKMGQVHKIIHQNTRDI